MLISANDSPTARALNRSKICRCLCGFLTARKSKNGSDMILLFIYVVIVYISDVTYVIALPCVDLKDGACVEDCPGGAAKLGLLVTDTAMVAALPTQEA